MAGKAEQIVRHLFTEAGVNIGGDRPWDIRVYDDRFFGKVIRGGSLALGETYVAGMWDCEAVDECIFRLLRARMETKVTSWQQYFIEHVWRRLVNLQSKLRAREQGGAHYNRGNAFFKKMLGEYMVYSCGYWKNADNVDAAQKAKMDLIFRKIGLQRGHRLLDIGCGWGELAKYAAETHDVEVVGVTVSDQQAAYAKELCQGLPVSIKLRDYRDLEGTFDRIVSVGMFEHIGHKNYRRFMEIAAQCLTDEGIFLLHTIGGNRSYRATDPWLDKYIFPGSLIPSMRQVTRSIEGLFICEDWHNFGPDYDKTLMAWHQNFEQHWGSLKSDFDQRFYRMWRYYLLICAGSFRARKNQLWQLVLTKNGVLPEYRSVR